MDHIVNNTKVLEHIGEYQPHDSGTHHMGHKVNRPEESDPLQPLAQKHCYKYGKRQLQRNFAQGKLQGRKPRLPVSRIISESIDIICPADTAMDKVSVQRTL